MELSPNAIEVLKKRYLKKDGNGTILESPEDLFHRVAKAIARAEGYFKNTGRQEYWENEFFNLMTSLDFLPNSPTLMNAGTNLGQLSACFVLPVEDSLLSIFETLKTAALIHQSGGGTGFNFSHLRPLGDFIASTSGKSSGPISFMMIYDTCTQYIKQGGKRRGANMAILNADHPDIMQFVMAKRAPDVLNNFNLSVGVSDEFMRTVDLGGDWHLRHPRSKKIVSTAKASELWEEIIESAWRSGDPGLIFLDTINRSNPTPSLGMIEATNPCGEVPLLPYEACNLGSINLYNMLIKAGDGYDIDWAKLSDTIRKAVRFLDNAIEINKYPCLRIQKVVKGNRKIGLGVMGWAELLIVMGIPYDSEEAVALGAKLMAFIKNESHKISAELAQERGVFPNWNKSIYFPRKPLRNATCTSIAPTGTISMIANVSPSIEPLFALIYDRKYSLDGKTMPEFNHLFLARLQNTGIVEKNIEPRSIEHDEASLLAKFPVAIRRLYVTALKIEADFHLKHQVAFQEFTDNAVSKTINLPQSATRQEVADAYMKAWKSEVKGITVYRYNSRRKQVMNLRNTDSCQVCTNP